MTIDRALISAHKIDNQKVSAVILLFKNSACHQPQASYTLVAEKSWRSNFKDGYIKTNNSKSSVIILFSN